MVLFCSCGNLCDFFLFTGRPPGKFFFFFFLIGHYLSCSVQLFLWSLLCVYYSDSINLYCELFFFFPLFKLGWLFYSCFIYCSFSTDKNVAEVRSSNFTNMSKTWSPSATLSQTTFRAVQGRENDVRLIWTAYVIKKRSIIRVCLCSSLWNFWMLSKG